MLTSHATTNQPLGRHADEPRQSVRAERRSTLDLQGPKRASSRPSLDAFNALPPPRLCGLVCAPRRDRIDRLCLLSNSVRSSLHVSPRGRTVFVPVRRRRRRVAHMALSVPLRSCSSSSLESALLSPLLPLLSLLALALRRRLGSGGAAAAEAAVARSAIAGRGWAQKMRLETEHRPAPKTRPRPRPTLARAPSRRAHSAALPSLVPAATTDAATTQSILLTLIGDPH